jgi:hypothetical protein
MANSPTPFVTYPAGTIDTFSILNQSAAQTFIIQNKVTILETPAGAPLTYSTAALTITASSSCVAGSRLFLIAGASGTTSTITLSGNVYGGTIAPTTGTTASIGYIYDGVNFYPAGTAVIH